MARKRNGLVPVGETSGSLDGPVKAIHDTSPQARHHFTQADQVNQLVSASERIPIWASWRGSWRCAACPAPTPASGIGMFAATDPTPW